ncbi:hypothetical protein J7K50_00065 [bacterium]|nr:hypothetical protein [bacterium]
MSLIQKIRFCISVALLSVIIVAGSAGFCEDTDSEESTPALPDAESIDPYAPDAGDFLDIDTQALEKAAYEAYQSGDYELSAKYYLLILRYDIKDSGSIYNLACCYGLLGEAELAAKYVERAVNAGFEDIEHIKRDPDFDSVRGEPAFDEVIERIAEIADVRQAELGEIVYIDSPILLQCRVLLPEGYDPDEKYPLLLGLHGYGDNLDRFILLMKKRNIDSTDFIYASLQAPYPFLSGIGLGYSWSIWDENEPMLWPKSSSKTENYIARAVTELEKRYSIDDVYLMGFSQGCGFTYQAGMRNPELFEGIICFGGWLDTDWIGEDRISAASGLRVFIAHGNTDRMVEFESGENAWNYLLDRGYDVTFYEFDGAHTVPEEALKLAVEWMMYPEIGIMGRVR